MNPDRKLNPAREQAAAWYERLHEDGAEAPRNAFADWLAESSEHRKAYAETERTWKLMQAGAHEPQILALRHETALRLTRASMRHSHRRRWAAAAAILVAAAGIVSLTQWPAFGGRPLLAWLSRPNPNRTYATTTGEQLSFVLADGSHVTLDTQSELQVAFSKSERAVRLTRGQALFEVAKDSVHPFVVSAAGRRFIAVGTAFNVRVSPDRLKFTMVEGVVRVERTADAHGGAGAATTGLVLAVPPAGTGAATPTAQRNFMTIKAGDQLVVDDQQMDHLYSADSRHETSWLRGELVFDNATLAEAVAELNRYSATRIEVADSELAELRLSGTFTVSRPELFVEAIANYFPVTASRGTSGTVFLNHREENPLPGSDN